MLQLAFSLRQERLQLMQLLCNLLEAVHLLPRSPDHAAAAQTIQRFEHRLAVLIQGSETARLADRDVVGRAGSL
ncbi:hypothetical protein [Bradyrhizobium vignae]|uniref:Uncharacterized protein n=1 Tax=Bradyrhizobium vignae TaxID=1549949 RepID=A0ABS3ZQP3_9BRAD|nr:hypothetical protein [Bradyrhizobium vignae]MBP0110477.1 hypothetical protein [Bradyrhizobium vignae]